MKTAVLVAEDNPATLAMLKRVLESKAYAVSCAESGTLAWELMQAADAPRLLLLDWQMPGLTGGEVCRLLRADERLKSAYVVILTGQDDRESLREAFKAGADDYIAKPFDLEELFSRLAVGARLLEMQAELNAQLLRLEESREQYRRLFELESDALFLVRHSDFCILDANAAAQRLYGYTQAELKGSAIAKLADEPDKARQAFTGETSNLALRYHRRKDGSVFPVEVKVSSFVWEGLDVHLAAVRDITERLELEESLRSQNQYLESTQRELEQTNLDLIRSYAELKETQSKILQQEKMVSIGQLAAGMAHEINNPVGFIISNLNTLAKYGRRLKGFIADGLGLVADQDLRRKLEQKKTEYKIDTILDDIDDLVGESLEGANRVKRLVMDLKSFSRVDQVEFKHADINECLESTLNIVWNELKYKAKIVKDLGELPPIKCYPQQLNQVFMNLLVNAAQAIAKQGTISIATRQLADEIEIRIADTGAGIAPEIRERVFEPFFTTKEVGQGTGLGLSITYDIVKKHGGDIRLESEVGQGSTFIVRLPIREEA